ncbi:Gfo/Idh/MocA family oxidoreductase [Nocardioides sp. LHG3406-4]|uniref:Gfo/Idh/MocA family oxidoreductase n=1 Tax=Nocardioides sp. LHG3406-4 TaxID=2804575 RepID=UPI003CF1106C
MRVGLVGTGRIGELHLQALAADPGCAELVVFDVEVERARTLAAAHGAQVAPSTDAVIESADALVIASPTPTHADLLRQAMAAGLPTFCEKPVATTLEEVVALAAAADRDGSVVQVGFHYRFDPMLRALAARARGDGPRSLRVHSTTEFAPSPAYLASAGGLVADKLIHELDLVRWLTGAEVLRVAALPTADPTDGGEPMTAALVLQLSDGGLANVWGGYRSAAGFDLSVEVESSEEVIVAGSRRSTGDAPHAVAPSSVVDFRHRFAAAYRAELVTFLDLARGAVPNPCPLTEAVRTQRVVAAAQEALASARVVDVRDDDPVGG